MRAILTRLALSACFVNVALATLGITVPETVEQGNPLDVSWHGGQPPYIFKILIDDVVVSQSNGWQSKQNTWVASKDNCKVGTIVKVRVIEKGGEMVLSDGVKVVAPKDTHPKEEDETTFEFMPTETKQHTKDKSTRTKEMTDIDGHIETVIVTETVTEQQTMTADSASAAANAATSSVTAMSTEATAAEATPSALPASDMTSALSDTAATGTNSSNLATGGASGAGGASSMGVTGNDSEASTGMSPTLKWSLIGVGVVVVLIIIGVVVWLMMRNNNKNNGRTNSNGGAGRQSKSSRRRQQEGSDEEALVGHGGDSDSEDGNDHDKGRHQDSDDDKGNETDESDSHKGESKDERTETKKNLSDSELDDDDDKKTKK
ncbi:hypothetical protein ACM66B_001027 [Microbotryomycetes sp. NB124-2]